MAETELLVCAHNDAMSTLPLAKLTADVRPKEFVKPTFDDEDSEEEESTVGKMPPSDSENDD